MSRPFDRSQQDKQQKSQIKQRVGSAHLGGSPLCVEELEQRQMLAVIAVTNLNDLVAANDGTSLREAIAQANASANVPDTIQFDPTLFGAPLPKNLALTGFLEITDALNIDGPDAAVLAISSAASEVFRISPLAGAVTIEGLSLKGTNAGNGGAINADNSATLMVANSIISGSTAVGNGGGIYATGDVVLSGSTVSGNNANYGGGIYALGDVTVRNSAVITNNAASYSGGIYAAGNALVQNSTVSSNTAGANAGGIGASGNVTVIDSTVGTNSSATAGGGIFAQGNVLVQNSTISGNDADTGGGIASFGNVTLQNSTVAANDALNDGGGIYTTRNVTLQNSTVSGNSANDNVGGLRGNRVTLLNSTVVLNGTTNNFGGVQAFALRLRNSIVAGNTTGVGTNPDLGFTTISTFFSLIGDATDTTLVEANPGPDAQGNKIGKANPILPATVFNLTLQNNGGPTLTHALLAGGPAVDAGSNNLAAGFTSDQRGTPFVRISGAKVDMGALEIQPPPGAPEINLLGSGQTILSGDVTPSTTDFTDFGTTAITGGLVTRTFVIQNTGNASLTVSNIAISGAHAGDFTISQNPVSPVAGGGSTTFSITFNPSDIGTRSALVTISNTDADEAAYTFAIQGTGANIAPGALPFLEDFDDDLDDKVTREIGTFQVVNKQYLVRPVMPGRNQVAVATANVPAPLTGNFDVRTTLITTPKNGEVNFSNGFIIFDYKSPTDFKVAGALEFLNRWVIGRFTTNGYQQLAAFNENIPTGVPLNLQVLLNGRNATLLVGGLQKVSATFPLGPGGETTFTGKIGIGTINSQATFDNFSITQLP